MFPNCFFWKGMGRIKNQNTKWRKRSTYRHFNFTKTIILRSFSKFSISALSLKSKAFSKQSFSVLSALEHSKLQTVKITTIMDIISIFSRTAGTFLHWAFVFSETLGLPFFLKKLLNSDTIALFSIFELVSPTQSAFTCSKLTIET